MIHLNIYKKIIFHIKTKKLCLSPPKEEKSFPNSLLLRQYNSIGELMTALEKTYVISSNTKKDVETLWLCLSKVRALLPVQMSQEEEELMRELLW